MFQIPLYVFLFLYFAFLLIFVGFAIVDVQHFVRAGALTRVSITMLVIFFAFAILVLAGTWLLLQGTNWQTPVNFGKSSGINFNNSFNNSFSP
jgi:hypothetical protein